MTGGPRRSNAPLPARSVDPAPSRSDGTLARRLADWFAGAARPLPWRLTPRDPYHSLLSEFMLQQTQVSRVLEKWPAFVARFPTLNALALADEHDVLAAWSGLGYYRRARLLHAAAREIVTRFGGTVPRSVEDLRSLPGVGRYTAGAIASIVFGQPASIVDGNVRRVLLRHEGRDLEPGEADRWAWTRAEVLSRAAHGLGVVAPFNEGMMELGATICMPRSPACGDCPLRRSCRARIMDLATRIPRPAARARVQTVHMSALVLRRGKAVLLRRRPASGLWANMWEPPTLERADGFAPRAEVRALLLDLCDATPPPRLMRVGAFDHQTTHRLVRFEVWRATLGPGAAGRAPRGMRFTPAEGLRAIAVSNAHARILALAGQPGAPRAARASST